MTATRDAIVEARKRLDELLGDATWAAANHNLRWCDLVAIQAALSALPDAGEEQPKVIDNDKDEITVNLNGRQLRGWSYNNDTERRHKMLQAREYVEGWCDGLEAKLCT